MQTSYDVQADSGESNGRTSKYLTFALGKQAYAIPIAEVREIIAMQSLTDIPDVPTYVRGVINLRGKVIPVVDVRMRLGMHEVAYHERTCIVVVAIEGELVGLIVDHVQEVVDIRQDTLEPPPKFDMHGGARFLEGFGRVDDEVKIILDVQAVASHN
jgi:purine-binding chemotaxis protein CheW